MRSRRMRDEPAGVQTPSGEDRGAEIGDDHRPEVGMRLYFILLLGLLRRALRSRNDLLMENLVLRQQPRERRTGAAW